MAHDVFISYSNKDKNAADAVCSIMEKNGIRCWIAPRNITPGAPFAEAIIDGIKGSKVFILVYSSNSNQSNQVVKEVDRAVHHRLAIIPLRLEDVPMSKQLEYYVSDVHWLDALTPPLEKHIDKLCKVVQMLLTMDKVDSDVIEEAFRTEIIKQQEPGKAGRRFKLSRILIPAVAVLFIVIILGAVWFFKQQAKIHWAREVALPEIKRLIGENDVWRNLVKPYQLAVKAEAILGKDTTVAALIHKCSRNIDVLTEPSGASVYVKEYVDPEAEWSFLGITPLKGVRVPIGIFRWKLEKEGYDTLFAAASTWDVGGEDDMISGYNFVRTMDMKDSLPAGLVRVPATETEIGSLVDFFIGRYEVTNKEYKAFMDAGGYRNREFWKHPFMKDGRKLTWEEAMGMFKDQTGRPGPETWVGGDYPEGQGSYPVSGVSWYEAAAYAEWAGMSLPTSVHWNVARGALTPMIIWPQLGGFGIFAPFTNFGGRGPVPVGSLPGITTYGAYDMAGNVREWCWNETLAGRVIRGGSWEDNTYEFGYERQAPPMDRSPRNGFRLALYPDTGLVTEAAFGFRTAFFESDYRSQPPVSDAIFKIYREQFSYDKRELNPTVESRTENPEGWIHERVSFDAAYGKERVLAHLFLPSSTPPPYQIVIYFPGDASAWMPSSEGLESYYEFTMFLSYLLRNGRAVLYPVYKGTFERGGPDYITTLQVPANMQTYAFTELLVHEVKDFRRSIDYIQTRQDIDSQKIAYLGMSWGAYMGSIIPAVENRIQTSVLIAGGLLGLARPEASDVSYVSRVRTPTLMLNGKYDVFFPPKTSSQPMFDLLGTPPEHKRQILYETDHIPPRSEFIKETLTWLDKYLGPVK
ncbi:MAG: SUMF1/EgtB/PvdO family nonheme iron enzyme [Bacteroidales bacterium]|nr:SUMF1/EgtB/PvdO family nonheme iron enzyme [Bacteroidales bacterium]